MIKHGKGTPGLRLLGLGENFTITGKDEAIKMNFDFGLSWFSQNKKHYVFVLEVFHSCFDLCF